MKVQVRDLPITRLAPQLGIPPEWAVTGNLTGAVDLSAASGTVRSIQGSIAVAPGSVARSHAVFPWKNATATIDWRPEAIAVRDIDVVGNGIRMTGTADVGGTAAQPLARRPFQATGAVHATRTEAGRIFPVATE